MCRLSAIFLILFHFCNVNYIMGQEKRSTLPLFYLRNNTVLHFIGGFGVPVEELNYEAVTTGVVIKAQYNLPAVPEDLHMRNSLPINGRSSNQKLYQIIEHLIEISTYLEGKACLLRSICEVAAIPIQQIGLIAEIMHIILTPTATQKDTNSLNGENEYGFAEQLGRQHTSNVLMCGAYFSECSISIVNKFTYIIEQLSV